MATPWLDGHHVAFGIVVDGMEVLDEIEKCGSKSGKPTAVVRIMNCGLLDEDGEEKKEEEEEKKEEVIEDDKKEEEEEEEKKSDEEEEKEEEDEKGDDEKKEEEEEEKKEEDEEEDGEDGDTIKLTKREKAIVKEVLLLMKKQFLRD